jgi:hypothetical protein
LLALAGCSQSNINLRGTQTRTRTETPSPSGPDTEASELAPEDDENLDDFGASVSITDDTILIGAPNSGDSSEEPIGSAYVFTRSGDTWSQQTKLTANDGEAGDQFGTAVALAGDTALVGTKSRLGSAYVFTRSGGTWSQQTKLAPDSDEREQFGSAVALTADTSTALIGADKGSSGPGSAYVFTRGGDTWSRQTKLHADDGDSSDYFGREVAIAGDTALIADPYDDEPNGDAAGSAYVFTRSGDTWSQQSKIAADDGDAEDHFGRSVALAGDTALVGAPYDEDPNGKWAGSAYAFTRSGDAWSQQAKLTAADGDPGNRFGFSASLTDGTAVIGAMYDEGPDGVKTGSAHVFTRSDDRWTQQDTLVAADGTEKDMFGNAIDMSGDAVLVGAKEAQSGAAYVYNLG